MTAVSLSALLAASQAVDPARVLVVDPDPATRARLGRLLGDQAIGEAASVDGALQAVDALHPTVILTASTLEAEPGAGLRLAVEAVAVDVNVQTVVHTTGLPAELPEDLRARARSAGALLVDGQRLSALLTAVRAANDVYRVLASERRSAERGRR